MDRDLEKLRIFAELYASLDRDYTQLGVHEIDFNSSIGIRSKERLDLVWKQIEQWVGKAES